MKKNIKALLLITSAALTIFSGCSAGSSGKGATKTADAAGNLLVNEEYSEDTMKTLSGKEIDIQAASEKEKLVIYDESGMGLYFPDLWDEYKYHDVSTVYPAISPNIIMIDYAGEKLIDMNEENTAGMTEDEIMDFFNKSFMPMFALYRTDKDSDSVPEEYVQKYAVKEKFGTWNGFNYYLMYNTDFGTEKLKDFDFSDSDVERMKKFSATLDDFKNNLILFEPMEAVGESLFEDAANVLTNFKAKDLDGNEINQDIFKNHDLTMINIWATWCGYCVEEFPEIAKLCTEKPANVNIITICTDGDEENELAKKILADNGNSFIALQPSEDLKKLLDRVYSLPTTIFVDKNGNLVGSMIEGARDCEFYLNSIEETLKELK